MVKGKDFSYAVLFDSFSAFDFIAIATTGFKLVVFSCVLSSCIARIGTEPTVSWVQRWQSLLSIQAAALLDSLQFQISGCSDCPTRDLIFLSCPIFLPYAIEIVVSVSRSYSFRCRNKSSIQRSNDQYSRANYPNRSFFTGFRPKACFYLSG